MNIGLVEDINEWGNVQGLDLDIATLQAENEWQNYVITLTQDDWDVSSLRLKINFTSTNNQARGYFDDIKVTSHTATSEPVAAFTSDVRYIKEGGQVSFFDLSSEAPNSFKWEFDPSGNITFLENTSPNSANPVVKFDESGLYSVTLTVDNGIGSNTISIDRYIIVNCPAEAQDWYNGHISEVQIGDNFVNPSENTNYSNFTNIVPEISINNDSSVFIQVSGDNVAWAKKNSSWGTTHMTVWLDWNNDGVFEEAGHALTITGTEGKPIGGKTVSLPEGFKSGLVGMRIKLAHQEQDVLYACGNVAYGEVEDYLMNFVSEEVSEDAGNQLNFYGAKAATDNPVLADPVQFTIEGWIKMSYNGGLMGIFGQIGDAMVFVENNELVFMVESDDRVSTPWLYNGQWIHVAGVANSTDMSLLVNGEVVASEPITTGSQFSNPNASFAIGGDVTTGDDPFIGSMDELRVWDIARTQEEIQNNMFSTVTGEPVNLISYFQFNEGIIGNNLKNISNINNSANLIGVTAESFVVSSVPYLWVGTAGDFDFNTIDNWSWGTLESPWSSNRAIIPENEVVNVNSISKIGSLEIKPGAQFTISENASLTILDSLILKNTYDQLITFMDLGDVIVPEGRTRIQLTVPKDYYWYLSSPLANARAEWFGNLNNDPNAEDWVFVLRESGGKNKWLRVVGDIALNPLEGVSTWYYNQDKQLDYSGTLNKGNISFTYGQPDYYLLGNPYATSIDWDILEAENRDGLDFAQTMWFRVSRTGFDGETYRTWQTYNTFFSAIDPEELGYSIENESYIAPYQTVWIKADVSNATFTVSENSKVKHTGALPLKSAGSSNNSEMDVLRIKAVNDKTVDGAVIFFNNAGDPGRDSFDSDKRFNDSKAIPELYTMLNSTPLAINSLPQLSGTAYSIPLSVRNRIEGEVKLSVDVREFTDAYDVVLEDKELSSWINMRDVSEYAYNPRIMGDDHDRFVLHLSKVQKVPTDIEESVDDALNIQIIGKKDYAAVRISPELLQSSEAVIHVLDVNGRQITNKNTRDTETEIALPSENGVYVVRVNAGGTVKTQKVIR